MGRQMTTRQKKTIVYYAGCLLIGFLANTLLINGFGVTDFWGQVIWGSLICFPLIAGYHYVVFKSGNKDTNLQL